MRGVGKPALQGFLPSAMAGMAIVAASAVIALTAGGSGLFGGLGGIFGGRGQTELQLSQQPGAQAGIVASPTAAQRTAGLRRTTAPNGRRVGRAPVHRHRAHPSPQQQAPPPLGPVPPSLPHPPPAPPPNGQVVETVGNTAKQVTGQAPPQLQPLTAPVDSAIDQLVAACQGLPTCP